MSADNRTFADLTHAERKRVLADLHQARIAAPGLGLDAGLLSAALRTLEVLHEERKAAERVPSGHGDFAQDRAQDAPGSPQPAGG